MTPPQFAIEPLAARHDRATFTCGVEALDRYFRQQAGQDARRGFAACFVARELSTGRIGGFYTLAASSVPLAEIPAVLAKGLPRYPTVPVARLGRLAVSVPFRGCKLAAALLWDAIERASRSEVAAYALVVDAKDDTAERFYLHHGFLAFNSLPMALILPLRKLRMDR